MHKTLHNTSAYSMKTICQKGERKIIGFLTKTKNCNRQWHINKNMFFNPISPLGGGEAIRPLPLLCFIAIYSKFLKATYTWKFLTLRIPLWNKKTLSEHFEIWVWKSPMEERVKEIRIMIAKCIYTFRNAYHSRLPKKCTSCSSFIYLTKYVIFTVRAYIVDFSFMQDLISPHFTYQSRWRTRYLKVSFQI